MTVLGTAIAVLITFGVIVFTLLFGQSPRLRNGFIGKFHTFLTVQGPNSLLATFKRVLGPANWARLVGCWRYSFESRNPFLQIFFLFLTGGSIGLFLKYALPNIPGIYLHPVHLYIIPAQILSLYASYYFACATDPGIVTKDNIQQFLDHYQYDGLLYEPKDCTTCHIPKPARSKHCSMCKACIGQLDHHCFWINQCVGVNNHRFFFLFLFTLTQFCAYGAYLCIQIYRGFVIEWGLDKAYMQDKATGTTVPLTFRKAMLHILQRDRIIGSIAILASVVSFVVFLFFLYQLYLAGRGVTTNEAFKWELIEDAIDRGELWIEEDNSDDEHKQNTTAKNKSSSKKEDSVFLMKGCDPDFWINVCLTLLGYIPGLLHGFYVMIKEHERAQYAAQHYSIPNPPAALGSMPPTPVHPTALSS
ncbi:DHHC palmitoyltransferase-domain-containing protein [Zychaea mexicana]|uniref:DHHC palmitoyltransferase-domain-containing protein n=1 Tax=Zychaea mexicana TaxID=64656 RepID=UPI0022FF2AA6|nr:DHHC palmitoyltransferase-domain-containing protein [Zychaea mexicana]KAI9499326.1 DHHC palmitoyltransferase-domain-containing protein [Zychaea mexicana]